MGHKKAIFIFISMDVLFPDTESVPHDDLSASDKPSPGTTSGVYVAAKYLRSGKGRV